MPPDRTKTLQTLTTLACVALALGFATPMVYACLDFGQGAVCGFTLNRDSAANDGRYFVEPWEAARVALADFHQLPSWNPYHCGGIVLYQDPQAPFPGPLFFLMYAWLPTVVAMK